ncbi:MAG TPA: kelch repeat-containing protein [Roseiflexaceae bacterium]|nr:kelch repeat-containing protein [Roseiflexaceae bacterium]
MLLITAIAFAALPPAPARAGVEFDEPVDEVIAGQFETGASTLTSLTLPSEEPEIQRGAVELTQVGNLQWFAPGSAENFPTAITEAGVASIGNHIFVVGGDDGSADSKGSNRVYRATINPATGTLTGTPPWTQLTNLRSVAHDSAVVSPTDRRRAPAVAARITNTAAGNGYLYVIGGSVRPGSSDSSSGQNSISSSSVEIATVVNGSITGWAAGPTLPSTPFENCPINPFVCGVEGASAIVRSTPTGRTFLYVIGGRQVYTPSGGSTRATAFSDRIFYAEINASGQLVQPGTNTPGWSSTFYRIPVDPAFPTETPNTGLFNTAVVGERVLNPLNGTSQDVLYIIGGETSNTTSTAQIFKYVIAADGTLTRDGSGAPGSALGDNAVATTARNRHGAFMWRGTVYYAGGRSGNTAPDNTTSYGLIEEDLTFARFGNQVSGAFFLANFQAFNLPSGDTGRDRAGYAIIPSNKLDPVGRPRTAWVYVIGGANAASQARDTIFRGEIGAEPQNPSYAPDGYFISQPRRIQAGSGVEIKEIVWRTDLPFNTDIRVEIRTSTNVGSGAQPCQGSDVTWSAWQEVDGAPGGATFSVDGNNSFEATGILDVNCFQYRAQLRGDGYPNQEASSQTPKLYALSIVVVLPGGPDLRFPDPSAPRQAVELIRNGNDVQLEVNILNRNDFETPTRAVSYGRNAWDEYANNQFFVDLFLYPPGVTPPNPHPNPPIQFEPPLPHNKLYAKIRFRDLSAENIPAQGISRTILGSEWCDTAIGPQCIKVNPLAYMKSQQVGTWKIVVVVDSGPNGTIPYPATGLVRETSGLSSDTRAEDNNVSLAFDVTITADDVVVDPEGTNYCPDRKLCVYTTWLGK